MSSTETNDKEVAEFLERFGILLSERYNIPLADVTESIEKGAANIDFSTIAAATEEEVLEAFGAIWSEEKM